MEKNLFDVKYRIFKRERAREGRNNLIIIPKNNKIINKNQLEFIWINKKLERDHLSILGRALVSEWSRILPDTPISRAFIQIKENDEIRFYISFSVEESLTSEQIKQIILTSLMALNDCLEKITKKVIGTTEFNQLFSLEEYQSSPNTNDSKKTDKTKEYLLIQKLQEEIEQQEELLKQLDEQQKKQANKKNENPISEPDSKEAINDFSETIEKLYTENIVLEKKIESLTKDVITTNETNLEVKKENNELKMELEELQKKQATNQRSQKQLDDQEKKIQILMKQNSDYRIKLVEERSIIDQYASQNKYLKESIEKIEQEKKTFIKQAQTENETLNNELQETEKNLIVVANNEKRQSEIIEKLRKKIAETTLDYDETVEKLNQTMKQLDKENEQFIETKKELKKSNEQVSQLEQEFKMAEATISLLKERKKASDETTETITQSKKWHQEYEMLLTKYYALEQEGHNYRQEINLLNSKLVTIQDKFVNMLTSDPLHEQNQLDINHVSKETTNDSDDFDRMNQKNPFNVFVDEEEEYHYFPYEADPYIEEVKAMSFTAVLSGSQEENQEKIRTLLNVKNEETYGSIKVDRSEYKRYLLDLRFLSYRWNQISSRKNVDINVGFLKWCVPFIKRVEIFEDELETNVKKAFLAKNTVVINESIYRTLKGYSMLSVYLDTYYFLN